MLNLRLFGNRKLTEGNASCKYTKTVAEVSETVKHSSSITLVQHFMSEVENVRKQGQTLRTSTGVAATVKDERTTINCPILLEGEHLDLQACLKGLKPNVNTSY